MPIRVLIADDHELVRSGLRMILESCGDHEIVGEAANGFQAVELAAKLVPDVVLMDISMPELNGVDATRRVLKAHPGIRVLALSVMSEGPFLTEILRAGARGYLLKDSAVADLVVAVRTVHAGQVYVQSRVLGNVLDGFLDRPSPQSNSPFARLSVREREILQLLAEGWSSRDIGTRLTISERTVEVHRSHIMKKLDLHSVVELTRYAIREGLVTLTGG